MEIDNSKQIVVATRPSKLAYTQTEQTVALLKEANPDIKFIIQTFSTVGDRDQKSSLTEFGGTGVFVKELESALISGEADIAIHSLKDVPNSQPEGLMLGAFPTREEANDVILTRGDIDIKDLPKGFTLGTGSPRRQLQIRRLRPDVVCREIRGNVETRIAKMEAGDYDAIILAAAGLKRLGIEYNIEKTLPIEQFIPAISQGMIAIECRKDDDKTKEIISKISDTETVISMFAERAFMKEIEGGCKFPLAAYAVADSDKKEISFRAIVGDLKSGEYMEQMVKFPFAEALQEPIILAQKMKTEAARRGYILNPNASK